MLALRQPEVKVQPARVLQGQQRIQALSWLSRLCARNRCVPATFFRAVWLFDAYFSLEEQARENVRLNLIMSFSVALSLHDDVTVKVAKQTSWSERALQLHRPIFLNTIGFNRLFTPTFWDFLEEQRLTHLATAASYFLTEQHCENWSLWLKASQDLCERFPALQLKILEHQAAPQVVLRKKYRAPWFSDSPGAETTTPS